MKQTTSGQGPHPDLITGIAIIVVAGFLLLRTPDMPTMSSLLPITMLSTLIGLSVLMILRVFAATRSERFKAPRHQIFENLPRFLGIVVAIGLYVVSVSLIGFYTTTAVMVPLVAWSFGYRDIKRLLSLGNFAAVVLGVITGICIGALPGLSATMAISVLIPFTFGMDPLVALGMMAGIYNGAMYGGAIPAVLLRIPGTPAAVATSFDGYPMAQQGRGGYALQVSVVSSAIGGIVSAIVLMLLAPPLAKVTLLFGPSEVFWVAVFGLSAIVFLLGGDVLKGLLSACFGVFVSLVGLDSISGYDRCSSGSTPYRRQSPSWRKSWMSTPPRPKSSIRRASGKPFRAC